MGVGNAGLAPRMRAAGEADLRRGEGEIIPQLANCGIIQPLREGGLFGRVWLRSTAQRLRVSPVRTTVPSPQRWRHAL